MVKAMWFDLLIPGIGLLALGWMSAVLYWMRLRSDADATAYFARDNTIKTLKSILVFVIIVLAILGWYLYVTK